MYVYILLVIKGRVSLIAVEVLFVGLGDLLHANENVGAFQRFNGCICPGLGAFEHQLIIL